MIIARVSMVVCASGGWWLRRIHPYASSHIIVLVRLRCAYVIVLIIINWTSWRVLAQSLIGDRPVLRLRAHRAAAARVVYYRSWLIRLFRSFCSSDSDNACNTAYCVSVVRVLSMVMFGRKAP
jgi:hypothetical protein